MCCVVDGYKEWTLDRSALIYVRDRSLSTFPESCRGSRSILAVSGRPLGFMASRTFQGRIACCSRTEENERVHSRLGCE